MLNKTRFVGHYLYLLIGTSLLLIGSLTIPWAPGFPVTAKLIPVPGLYIARAPQDAIIEAILANKRKSLNAGQVVVRLRYLQNLSQDTGQTDDLKRLENRRSRLNAVLSRQEQLYKKYQMLADKKLISMVDFLHKQDEMRRLWDEKEELHSKITTLQLKMGGSLRIPFAGVPVQQLVEAGQIVKAKQPLIVLRPCLQSYALKVKLPLIYQKYVQLKQVIKLTYMQNEKIKMHPIQARVTGIYPTVINQEKLGSKDYYVLLRASVKDMPNLNLIEGIQNLPLEGYLMGPSRPIYQWIFDIMQGNK